MCENNKERTTNELISEIPSETLEWLESIGLDKYKAPVLGYVYCGDVGYYIEYLKDSRLDVLKEEYQRFYK